MAKHLMNSRGRAAGPWGLLGTQDLDAVCHRGSENQKSRLATHNSKNQPRQAVLCSCIRRSRKPRLTRHGPRTFACASPSNRRSRSICILKVTGSSRSSFNDDCSLSPIARTIARLCEESMSTRFRMMYSPLSRNPNKPRHQSRWHSHSSQPKLKRRPPSLAIVRERLCLNSGSEETFGYPRHAPFLDGGRRSRTPNHRGEFSFPI